MAPFLKFIYKVDATCWKYIVEGGYVGSTRRDRAGKQFRRTPSAFSLRPSVALNLKLSSSQVLAYLLSLALFISQRLALIITHTYSSFISSHKQNTRRRQFTIHNHPQYGLLTDRSDDGHGLCNHHRQIALLPQLAGHPRGPARTLPTPIELFGIPSPVLLRSHLAHLPNYEVGRHRDALRLDGASGVLGDRRDDG